MWLQSSTINKYTKEGNWYINDEEYNTTVFRRKYGWSYRIVRRKAGEDDIAKICPLHKYYPDLETTKIVALASKEDLANRYKPSIWFVGLNNVKQWWLNQIQ